MGIGLIAIGILLEALAVMIAYIFDTPKKDGAITRIKASIRLYPSNIVRPLSGITLMQIAAIYWILIGALLSIIGDIWLNSFFGGVIFYVILGLPLLIGAICVERRQKK